MLTISPLRMFVSVCTPLFLIVPMAWAAQGTETRESSNSARRTVASYLPGTKTKHGPFKEYDVTTGVLLTSGTYDNGEKEGLWTTCGSDGAKIFETPYVHGKREGVERQFGKKYAAPLSLKVVDPAVPVAETTYVGGQKHGSAKEWLPDGTLQKECSYAFDLLHGPYRSYFLNGRLAHEGLYLFGEKVGAFKHWGSDGKQKPSTTHALSDDASSGALNPGLERALQFADSRYSGWTYGSDSTKRQVDCTQFVEATVLDRLGSTLGDAARRALHQRTLMTDLGSLNPSELAKLVSARDSRTKGVQQALVDLGLGAVVSPADAQPGDIVQYWSLSNGVSGHAAVITQVSHKDGKTTASLFGSHKSRGGIGILRDIPLDDAPNKRITYIVRPK